MKNTGLTKTINQAFSKVKSKVMNLIKFSGVTLVLKDDRKFSRAQVTYLGQTSDVTTMYPYGIYANAPIGSLALMFNIQGDEANKIAILEHYESRFKGLLSGEVIHGNPISGSHVKYAANGDVILTVKGEYIINIDQDYNLTMGGNHNVLGNEFTGVYTGNYALSAGNVIVTAGTSGEYNMATTGDITFDPNDTVFILGDLDVSGTINGTGLNLSGGGDISSPGTQGTGDFTLSTSDFFYAVLGAMHNGVISIDGDFSQVIQINGGDSTKFDVLEGRGLFLDNSALGNTTPITVEWSAQTALTPISSEGFVIVAVNQSGTVVTIDNDLPFLTAFEQRDFIQLGFLSFTAGNIDEAKSTPFPITRGDNAIYSSWLTMGAMNFPVDQGISINPLASSGLEIELLTGTTAGLDVNNIDTPFVRERTAAISPVNIILLTDSRAGSFTISPTAELDPTLISKIGDITKFSTASGGTETKVTSNSHGLQNGDTAVLPTSIYAGTFIISNSVLNSFIIPTAFISDDSPATWQGLATITSNDFSGQRIDVINETGIVIAYYGLDSYSNLVDYDTEGGEYIENFDEPLFAYNAVKTNIFIMREDLADFDDSSLFKVRRPITRLKS